MLIYTGTKKKFREDVMTNNMENIVLAAFSLATGRTVSKSESTSWGNSLQYMDRIISDGEIPDDVGVSIEYQIPQTSKRIDFVITGSDQMNNESVVLIELKQWETASLTEKDAIVRTRFRNGEAETAHPSYQVWSYKCLLEDYNSTVYEGGIKLHPCAYLHNYIPDNVIRNRFYSEYIEEAPVFLKNDALKLTEFIKKYIKHGDNNRTMFRIDHGKIRPTKNLANELESMLNGNREFILIDDQKLVYETALKLAETIQNPLKTKQVFIVNGGPGTGKSVVAINLLVELVKRGLTTQYVTRNSAPREVYEAKLSGSLKKSRITNLFSGSGSYHSSNRDDIDCLLVDEAHRLNEKSGLFGNLGKNQIMEIIRTSRLSVFFLDEDQKVTLKDIGDREEVTKWAKDQGAFITEQTLSSQFRCNGSDGYLSWLDSALQIHETANLWVDDLGYDFQVFDYPQHLHDKIIELDKKDDYARLLAGYCWKWVSSKDQDLKDIVIGNYEATWNLKSDGQSWIIKPNSVNEVGCIHTSQGLEVNHVGVIIGPDLIVRDGKIITDVSKRASSDKSVQGWKKLFQEDPSFAKQKFDEIIKNTYRTLMTRGSKSCYIYSVDPETNLYFKNLAKKVSAKRLVQFQ